MCSKTTGCKVSCPPACLPACSFPLGWKC
jgi:hypothetical protein